jgi:hypothetical protein
MNLVAFVNVGRGTSGPRPGEGSQTSPRRLKLREASSGKPLWLAAPRRSLSDVAFGLALFSVPGSGPAKRYTLAMSAAKSDLVNFRWQFCKVAAGGSRARPSARQFYGRLPNRCLSPSASLLDAVRWVIPGSRLLPSDRTAIL